MNEKIKELAEQAMDDLTGCWLIPDQFCEEFAELIVRQCINIACNYDKPNLSGPGHAIASYMEAHFDIYTGEDGRFVK